MEGQVTKKSRKLITKKKAQWSNIEESLLITLWADHIGELRGCRRNSHILQEIKLEMSSSGFEFTAEEIKIKIHNLTNKYRDEKRKIGPSGGSPSNWCHYDRIHNILGSFKSNSINLVMEESIYSTSSRSTSTPVGNVEIERLDDSFSEFMDETNLLIQESPEESLKESPPPRISKKRNFQAEILKKIDESNEIMKEEFKGVRETDKKIIKIQEEMLEIEKNRNEILKLLLNN